MPRLVANAALRYASRDMKAGEEFDASEKDAHVLRKTGKANDAVRSALAAQPAAQSATPTESDAELFSGDPSGRRGGRHNRRDMRAKD